MARKPFVVLDAEILSSSVWAESASVRLVWITLLILCDTEGYVGAAVPGIARAAGVTMEECETALARLQEPDQHSRTKANDGRRLEMVERGFRVLNFLDHLDRLSAERTRARERMRRFRKRREERNGYVTEAKKRNRSVTNTDMSASVRSGSSEEGVERSEEGVKENGTTDKRIATSSPFPSPKAADIYLRHYPQGTPPGAMFKALRPLVVKHGWEPVAVELEAYLVGTEITYHSWPKFAAGFGRWAKVEKADNLSPLSRHNMKALGLLR